MSSSRTREWTSTETRSFVLTIAILALLLYPQFSQDLSAYLPEKVERKSLVPSSRNNKVILLGPHDRYNFGDLLFSKVLEKLLVSRAGYSPDQVLFGGLVSVDMSPFGGSPNVLSMKEIQKMSQNDAIQGPYDIIFTGGESLGCDHSRAKKMMPDKKSVAEAAKEKIHDCAYLIPKRLLLPTSGQSSPNYAIMNSLGGGGVTKVCTEAVDTADYVSYRDHDPLFPDSAVMTKELFADEINAGAKEALRDLKTDKKYIAVQHRKIDKEDPKEIASALDEVSRGSNATIVFFAAGTVHKHDSFESYEEVKSLMTEEAIVYRGENIWKVVGLISRAEAVISTSLHVRIMAFIYFKPRVTWGLGKQKLRKFIELWDANSSAPEIANQTDTWSTMRQHYFENPDLSMKENIQKYERAVKKYLESFSNFSTLLRPQLLSQSEEER